MVFNHIDFDLDTIPNRDWSLAQKAFEFFPGEILTKPPVRKGIGNIDEGQYNPPRMPGDSLIY
jgi:hypothetical protein